MPMWGVPVQLLRVLTPMWPTSAPGLAQVCSYSASLIDLMGPTAPPPSVAPQVQLGAIGAAASAVLSSDEAKAELQRVRQQVGELEGSLQVRRAIGLHNQQRWHGHMHAMCAHAYTP